jgi:hypothetical protein
VTLQQISSLPHSTALPPLQRVRGYFNLLG